VDQNLNVSTGLIGPYLDMGLLGIASFTALLGASASFFWRQRQKRFYLFGYLYIAPSLFLSVFYDVFLYLPFLFQLFWFGVFLRPISRAAADRTLPAPSHQSG
jgi:hypothetical protein